MVVTLVFVRATDTAPTAIDTTANKVLTLKTRWIANVAGTTWAVENAAIEKVVA